MSLVKSAEPEWLELSIEQLAQILLTLDENEVDTLEILLDPQARITLEQSLQDIAEGDVVSIENW